LRLIRIHAMPKPKPSKLPILEFTDTELRSPAVTVRVDGAFALVALPPRYKLALSPEESADRTMVAALGEAIARGIILSW
jgi:hypothetical protein